VPRHDLIWRGTSLYEEAVVANGAQKTEHSGAKKGCGAYWGRKKFAKKESNKLRRLNDKKTKEEIKNAD